MSAWADAIARGWTAWYTRRVADDVAERRRSEIRSDLYEHAAASGCTPTQQFEVLGRVLWGIPADLSWRRAARAPRERRLETGESMTLRKVTFGLFAVYALFDVWAALGVILNPDGGGWPWGVALLGGATLIVLGLRARDDSPRQSTVLLSLGALAPLSFYWMLPLFLPIAVGLIWLAIVTEPDRRTPAPAV